MLTGYEFLEAAYMAKMMSGGKKPVIRSLSVTANGTYTVPEGVDGYNPVYVNVKSGSLSLNEIKNWRNMATVTIGDYKWECKSPVVSTPGVVEIQDNQYKRKFLRYRPTFYFLLNGKYAMAGANYSDYYSDIHMWYTQDDVVHYATEINVNYWVTGASFKGNTATYKIAPQFGLAMYSDRVKTNDGVALDPIETYWGDMRCNPNVILTNMSAEEQVDFEAEYLQKISTATPIIEIMPKVE